MSTTLTIRADNSLRDALRARAAAQGKTVSALIREILEQAVAERPMATRVGHLKARLEISSTDTDPWRPQISDRNWRS